jgi:hypothetical protein
MSAGRGTCYFALGERAGMMPGYPLARAGFKVLVPLAEQRDDGPQHAYLYYPQPARVVWLGGDNRGLTTFRRRRTRVKIFRPAPQNITTPGSRNTPSSCPSGGWGTSSSKRIIRRALATLGCLHLYFLTCVPRIVHVREASRPRIGRQCEALRLKVTKYARSVEVLRRIVLVGSRHSGRRVVYR